MHSTSLSQRSISIHLTNVTGIGASQLLESLLPALVECDTANIRQIYLPETGLLSRFSSAVKSVIIKKYRRFLPKAISRFLECTLFSYQFDDSTPILVLGDLPLRVKSRQTLFVQTSHLIVPQSFKWHLGAWKFRIARFIFRLNLDRVSTFIVQTERMRDGLINSYPSIKNRIHIIAHPVPAWLLESHSESRDNKIFQDRDLRLFYPAAGYPHKNHSLLNQIEGIESDYWPVESLLLTIDDSMNPAPKIAWVHCVGLLTPSEMIRAYGGVDGLVFLSKQESLGFPLLEAMYLGLPVVCPDLPYARTLCGDQAIYFDPDSVQSLRDAITQLKELLSNNWKPDWSGQLRDIPKTWEDVASQILDICMNYS